MSFDFFTFGSRFFWEDVFNYDNWVIQLNVRSLKYRLVDSFGVRRESGTFEQCKETLIKYIHACELKEPKDNTVIILHGFGKKKSSIEGLAAKLDDINANIIPLSYATLRRGVGFHANILTQMLDHMEIKGKLFIINAGASCLITRKFLNECENYRRYNIEGVIDINPINSGSDFADLFVNKKIINFILGPMFKDIATRNAIEIDKLPAEINHGIIFSSNPLAKLFKSFTARYESFPLASVPNENSYAEKIKKLAAKTWNSLNDKNLATCCKNFIVNGDFDKDYQASFSKDNEHKNNETGTKTKTKK